MNRLHISDKLEAVAKAAVETDTDFFFSSLEEYAEDARKRIPRIEKALAELKRYFEEADAK